MEYLKSKDTSIRTEDGKWLNSDVFRQEAIKFMKNRYFCPDPTGSPSWFEYWTEQLNRCINGYEVGGHKITGHHYEYLNFSQIEIVDDKEEDSKIAKKETKNPDFWDGDFDYFWSIEIAKNGVGNKQSLLTSKEQKEYLLTLSKDEQKEAWIKIVEDLNMKVIPHPDYLDGGNHMIVGKSRRKGYSYKNASICVNTYNTIRKSLTVIGAFDKKYLYPKGTMGMASAYMSFLNKHTGWSKAREFTDKVDIKIASYKETDPNTNISNEAGYLSTVMATTFGDNPDAARGIDALFVLMEEAGKFPNLKNSYEATKPGLTAGKYITGQILIFGTGGDMESGTVDFADMFYHPLENGLMPFVNIWDENATNSYCGFFHPVYINMEGHYDEQGNSDVDGAITEERATRDKLKKNATSSVVLQKRVQEYPMSPSEAFLTVSVNDFPIMELRNQYNRVIRENLHLIKGQPVYLERIEQKAPTDDAGMLVDAFEQFKGNIFKPKIRAVPDLTGELVQPLWDYKPKTADLKGGIVIYEYPVYNTPRGLYKIGFDPYRQQHSSAVVPSLASIYVYKTVHKESIHSSNTIVAQYVGRPYDPDDVNRTVEMLAELYNAEIMYENEVTHVLNYFTKKRKLHLLAAQPEGVISKAIGKSKVARTYGIHMVEKLKDAGEKYIKQWLLEERTYDENGTAVLNLETIYDPALLDELILYNRKGNFDRCLTAGTKITTDNGIKNIEEIDVDNLLLTSNGYNKVINKIKSNFKGNIVDLNIIGQADILKVTDNHPLLIASISTVKHNTRLKVLDNINYKRADSLTDKYQFCLLPKRTNLQENLYSDDMLYLMGWMMGDGYVNEKTNQISICLQHDQEGIADRLIDIIDRLTFDEELTIQKPFIRNGIAIHSKRTYSNTPTIKNKQEGYIKINKTSKKLTTLFLSIGCNPSNKKMSQYLYNSSNLMPFVIGLFEADGHQKFNNIGKYERCNIEIATIYKDLLLQVRQILIDNSIWSSISNAPTRNGGKEQLRLNISTNYINKFLSYYYSLKFKTCNIVCQKEIQIETEIGFWTPISIVAKTYQEVEVYNIEIENQHNYLANGIVNHNCMSFMMVMFQCAEDDEGKEYGNDDKTHELREDFMNLMQSQFRR